MTICPIIGHTCIGKKGENCDVFSNCLAVQGEINARKIKYLQSGVKRKTLREENTVVISEEPTIVQSSDMTSIPAAIVSNGDAAATSNGGLRYDTGKPRYDLIPPAPIKALAEHYAAGATKYKDRNWEAGMSWGTCIRAAQSHFTEWQLGHTHDIDPTMPEGYKGHHLIAAIWNLVALYEYERRQIGTDDRPCAQFETPYPEEITNSHDPEASL